MIDDEVTKRVADRLDRLAQRIDNGKAVQAMLISIGRTWQASARKNATRSPKVDTGTLRDSLQFRLLMRNSRMVLELGSYGVPYAAIHEFGGVIRPKTGKYLTIPAHKDYRGRRAREIEDLVFIGKYKGGRKRKTPFLWDEYNNRVAFWLVKRVEIKEKRYMRDALEKTRKRMPAIIRRYWQMGLRYVTR